MSATISSLERDTIRTPHEELARIVDEWTPEPGVHSSVIEGVHLTRFNAPTSAELSVREPSLAFLIQGKKTVRLGDQEIVGTDLAYAVCTVHLPVLAHVQDASPERPYLAAKITMQPAEVAELVMEAGDQLPTLDSPEQCPYSSCGLCMAQMDMGMQDALMRLLSLFETPSDIPVLAPLVRREIIYRALIGELGPRIRKFVATDTRAHRISRVIDTLKERFDKPLRAGELAEAANMSESSLFHSFKEVTRMSPLQFQKRLRLQEARRLMLIEGLEAAAASYRVGYESPSHFSREYSRMFGAPPREDVGKLRRGAETADVPHRAPVP